MKKTIISRYSKLSEALMAQSYLLSYDIPSELVDQHIVSMNWFYSNLVGGVKLAVEEEQAERALELLAEVESGSNELRSDIVYGPECPNCGSENTELHNSHDKGLALILLFLTAIPLLFLNRESYVCVKCEHKWSVKSSLNWSALLGTVFFIAGIYFVFYYFIK